MNNETNNKLSINLTQDELCIICAVLEDSHKRAKVVGKKVEALWIAMMEEKVTSINTVAMVNQA